MLSEPGWLSLKVVSKDSGRVALSRPQGAANRKLVISIPRKVVPLATKRNRIKRLLREAVRQDPHFQRKGKLFCFRVHRFPGAVMLGDVKKVIERLK